MKHTYKWLYVAAVGSLATSVGISIASKTIVEPIENLERRTTVVQQKQDSTSLDNSVQNNRVVQQSQNYKVSTASPILYYSSAALFVAGAGLATAGYILRQRQTRR